MTTTISTDLDEAFDPLYEPELFPVDRLVFDTNLQISRDAVISAKSEHIKNVRLPKDSVSSSKMYQQERTIAMQLHGGVRLLLADLGPKGYSLRRVEFNPGKLVHGHNGLLLFTSQVLLAFSILCRQIEPLLTHPNDADRLFPGCHPESPSYWSAVEIAMHLYDPDGSVLFSLRNARHPSIRKKATVYEGESITMGGRRSDLMINIYRKDIEMARLLKDFGITEASEILRVEVTLRKEALIHFLGYPGNTAKLRSAYAGSSGEPQLRLIRFRDHQAMDAHKGIMRLLKGISRGPFKGDLPTNERPGRMLGLAATHTGTSVEELVDLIRLRFDLSPSTVTRMRSAAVHEVSLRSTPTGDLFADDRYRNQPIISIPQLELSCYPDDYPSKFRPMIEANYGTRPASSDMNPFG